MPNSSITSTVDQGDTPPIARVAYETMQFFEIELPNGADPETYCDTIEARTHFVELITSGFISFKLERRFGEDGEEL